MYPMGGTSFLDCGQAWILTCPPEMQSDQHRNRLDRFKKDLAYLAEFRYRGFNIFLSDIILFFYGTLPVVRPTAAYRLPHQMLNIADLLSCCYASRALEDQTLNKPIFSVQGPTDARIHLVSQIHLARREYQFGFYVGKDGHTHLGFDVAERQNSLGSIDLVHKVDPGRALYLNNGGWRFYFRPPRII